MRRRALLASIPALATLPGCNARNTDSSTGGNGTTTDATGTTATTTASDTSTQQRSTETTTETSTETTTETTTATVRDPGYPRFVELASVDGTDYTGLTFDATVDSRRIDSAETATLLAILQNTGETTLELEMGYNPPFSTVRCEDGGYLLLKPDTAGELDACWEQDHYPGRPALLTKPTLEPGETLTNEMVVLGDTTTDACLPTGTFRFVSDFTVTRDGETEGRANAFTIRVAKE